MKENAFFKNDDNKLGVVAGFPIPAGWWSRPHEYAFCLPFAEPGHVVADMGCGYHYRPFTDALAEIAGTVYAIDSQKIQFDPEPRDNVFYMTANFAKDVPLESETLDAIFCISVLEDLGEMVGPALKEFARLLKPHGTIVITMDLQYDMEKPLGQYPGVRMDGFVEAVDAAGLSFREMPDYDKSNALYNVGFNLTPFHCVLVKKPSTNGEYINRLIDTIKAVNQS